VFEIKSVIRIYIRENIMGKKKKRGIETMAGSRN